MKRHRQIARRLSLLLWALLGTSIVMRLTAASVIGNSGPGLYAWPVLTAPPDPPIVDEEAPTIWLKASAYLEPLPDISRTSNVVLAPEDFDSWAEVFALYPTVLDFLLTPGDYTSWGALEISDMSGESGRRRTIRYFNPADDYLHPVLRANEARIDGGSINDSSSYWHLHGLTIRNPTATAVVWDGCAHNVFDWMVVEDSTRAQAFRLFHSNNTIQRCVLRDSAASSDALAIQIKPVDSVAISGIKVLDCEIYDWGDGFGVTGDGTIPETAINFRLDGTDIYQTGVRYLPGGLSAENAIDVKSGDDATTSYITNSRIWGFRRGTGASVGDAIVFHRYCRNITMEDCFISDCPSGIREENWPAGEDLEAPRNLVARRVHFRDIRNYSGVDSGACVQPVNNTLYEDCSSADCDYVGKRIVPAYRAGGPEFDGWRRINTTLQNGGDIGPIPYTEPPNTVGDDSVGYANIQRKRWTGPEIAVSPLLSTDSVDFNRPPIPGFTLDVEDGLVEITSTATDEDGTISTYLYTWGDGASSSSASPSHTYSRNGIYSITQTVTDNDGAVSKLTKTVEITGLVDDITMPSPKAVGALVHDTVAITVPRPAHVAGDLHLLIVEHVGLSTCTLDTAAGFVESSNSPQDTGVGSPDGTKVTCFWHRCESSSEPDPVVHDTGNHQVCRIVSFEDVIAIGLPFDVQGGDFLASASTSMTIPGGTTTIDECLIVLIGITAFDSLDPQFSGWTNGDLTDLTEMADASGDTANGGGIGVATGGKAVAGAFGATTVTLANAAYQARLVFALKGAIA